MSDNQPIVATWLVADTPAERSHYPQVPGDSASLRFQEIYWRCVICFFATAVKMQVPARLILFTNVASVPVVDGYDLDAKLRELGVEVVRIPITYRLRTGTVQNWGNQFYILDVIQEAQKISSFQSLTVLDSDCVWVRPAEGFFSDLMRYEILTLELAHREDEPINGVSRSDMKEVVQRFTGRPLSHIPHYVGGEIFACTAGKLAQVRETADRLWELIKADDKPILREEAHLLSAVYDIMGVCPGTADAHLKRMWTAFRLSNVSSEDIQSGRCLWHLPYEKRDGFADLFTVVMRPDSDFWRLSKEHIPVYIARLMGVPRRNARKWVRDVAARLSGKFLRALRSGAQRSQKL
jgi:hypothetical protein